MSSSTHSQPEGAKAQIPQLGRVLEAQRNKPSTVAQGHETLIDSLKRSFETSQQFIIRDIKNALKVSADNKHGLELQLQEEKQRVIELTKKLDETKNSETTVELASEKVEHGLTKIALDKSKDDLVEEKRLVAYLEAASKVMERQIGELRGTNEVLETTLGAVAKRKDQVQAELERSKRESANLQQRLNAAEQQNVNVQATLKAAEQRALTAENKLNRFNSMFKTINDETTTAASSSEQQPNLAQPSSSAPAPFKQCVVEQSDTGHQTKVTTRPQSIDSQVGNGMSDGNPDLLHCKRVLDQVMDAKHGEINCYFLSATSLHDIAGPLAEVGPMALGTIQQKLADRAYNSVTSFKQDFYSMIADVKRLNSPSNPVYIAAERLSNIFDQAFSSQSISGHKFGVTAPAAEGYEKKRKAEYDTSDSLQDEPAQKRPSLASHQPEPIDTDQVDRKITAGKHLGIEATLSSVAQLVSFKKSPSTITGNWKSLLPQEFCLTKCTMPSDAQKRISALVRDDKLDMIVLRLTPASETDRPNFDRILQHLHPGFEKEKQFAAVNHVGLNNVVSMDLIPTSRVAPFPGILATLNFDEFPPTHTEDMLFIAIVFLVAKDKWTEVRMAWNERMAAVQNHDEHGLTAMRNTLACSPLHTFQNSRFLLTSAERYLAKVNQLPVSENSGLPELQGYGQSVLRVSYNIPLPMVDGISAPEWAFVLGCLTEAGVPRGLLVVDVQNYNRPVWLLRYWNDKSPSRRSITLLAGTFPGSLDDWQKKIPERTPTKDSDKNLEDTGVMLERCLFHD